MYKYAGQGGAVRAAVTAVLAALGLTAAIWVTAGDSARAASADTVLRNGTVLTMDKKDSVASAVAIRKGRIVYTGTDRGVRKWIGKNTKVMNLKGATAMPGMVDGHAHPLLGGDVIDDCDLGNIEATIPELLAVMTECDQADPAKDNSDWLKVSNWNPVGVLPQGTVVTRQDLDTAFPNRPIYIQGSDFHNSWVNSRALEIAGITSETPNPPNGEFVRDELGNPTGLLKDGAQRIVRASIPPKPFDEAVADGLRGIKAMNATGITTTAESVAEPDSFKVWKELNRTGKLSIRMNSFPAIGSEETADQAWKDYRDLQREFEGGRLRLPGIKLVLDGVIEYPAQTAALLKPYLMEDGGQWVPGNNRGELYHSNAQTNALVKLFDQKKRLIHMHAIGDRATRQGLNAAAVARKANHSAKRLNISIGHLQLVDPADYPRFRKLGVIANMQLQWAISNFWTEEALRPYIGEQRYKRMYPAHSLVAAGAPFSMGSDWPVDPLNPWREIMTARTRSSSYGGPLNPSQGISLKRALKAHTMGAAVQLGLGKKIGSLEPGKFADIVVVDRNPLKAKVSSIENTKVLRTMVQGETVYKP
ncbi:MAG: amidohydrolase [Solirubrobacterales bacterium]|nr:amidohydrolase [Solirubrobacterales bacterium]